MIPSLPAYEAYIYSLPERHPTIQTSTLVVKRTSATSAQVTGIIYFAREVTLRVLETIDFLSAEIVDYSYEVRQGSMKLYWYDCWPHPDDPRLASTHPHHKHTPPDIKHHRIPAPEMSFSRPNLTFVIEEIEQLLDTL
jgi:hypothetical protein